MLRILFNLMGGGRQAFNAGATALDDIGADRLVAPDWSPVLPESGFIGPIRPEGLRLVPLPAERPVGIEARQIQEMDLVAPGPRAQSLSQSMPDYHEAESLGFFEGRDFSISASEGLAIGAALTSAFGGISAGRSAMKAAKVNAGAIKQEARLQAKRLARQQRYQKGANVAASAAAGSLKGQSSQFARAENAKAMAQDRESIIAQGEIAAEAQLRQGREIRDTAKLQGLGQLIGLGGQFIAGTGAFADPMERVNRHYYGKGGR